MTCTYGVYFSYMCELSLSGRCVPFPASPSSLFELVTFDLAGHRVRLPVEPREALTAGPLAGRRPQSHDQRQQQHGQQQPAATHRWERQQQQQHQCQQQHGQQQAAATHRCETTTTDAKIMQTGACRISSVIPIHIYVHTDIGII